jgi:F-type H+-transporting ATPase subunit delta
MTNQLIARRYARALLEVAKEKGKIKEYGDQLQEMRAYMEQVPEVGHILNPAISFSARKEAWQAILEYLQLDELVKNFLMLLADRSRLAYLAEITSAYHQFLDEIEGVKRVQVHSPAPLDHDTINALISQLQKRSGSKIILDIKEDPSLIGGLTVQIGDLVLDGSVKGELARLKDSLTRGNLA